MLGSLSAQLAKEQRLRVVIFIENDIIYRHFVKSGAFSSLAKEVDLTFVFAKPEPGNKRLTTTLDPAEIGAPFELLAIEPRRIFLWRQLFQVSQLVWRPGADWKHLRRITRHLVGRRASQIYSIAALPGLFQLFRWWTQRQLNRLPSTMAELIARLKPDVVIHPTVFDGYFINDLVQIGRRLGVPTVAIMNSWDNPSTKRTVVGQPDWVLVWGPQTKAHAVRYMDMRPDRVVEFGAAQFDIFARPPRVTRAEFCRRHGIDPAKRVLLYAGSSKGSDEFRHLCLIEQAIERGELTDLAIVYRPHPWGEGGYKGERLLDHPWRHVAIDNSMRAYLEGVRAGRKAVFLAEYADTHDTLSSVDALVSPLSTIILEGALHGKPVLCFMPEHKEGSSFILQKQLIHFEEMFSNSLIFKAHGEAELIGAVATLMEKAGHTKFTADLRQSCQQFVTSFDRPYAERLSAFVANIAMNVAPQLS